MMICTKCSLVCASTYIILCKHVYGQFSLLTEHQYGLTFKRNQENLDLISLRIECNSQRKKKFTTKYSWEMRRKKKHHTLHSPSTLSHNVIFPVIDQTMIHSRWPSTMQIVYYLSFRKYFANHYCSSRHDKYYLNFDTFFCFCPIYMLTQFE